MDIWTYRDLYGQHPAHPSLVGAGVQQDAHAAQGIANGEGIAAAPALAPCIYLYRGAVHRHVPAVRRCRGEGGREGRAGDGQLVAEQQPDLAVRQQNLALLAGPGVELQAVRIQTHRAQLPGLRESSLLISHEISFQQRGA